MPKTNQSPAREHPAAVEAARKINEQCFRDTEFGPAMLNRWAAIIDSTAHVGELREALQKLKSYNEDIRDGKINYRPQDHIDAAESVLAKLPKG